MDPTRYAIVARGTLLLVRDLVHSVISSLMKNQ
jgi:hypothetical protein